jgi:shikimate dehydrogenase
MKTATNNNMRKAFVCGYPIKHSRSPLIHGYWLDAYGINGTYEKIEVAPGQLRHLFDRIRNGEFIGGNVTLPHKTEAIELVDRFDEPAELIGAINTVWIENGILHGTNTDWIGFVESLDAQTPNWDVPEMKEASVVVLGAGGASLGILYGLEQRGFRKIVLANRTLDKADAVSRRFGSMDITTVTLDSAADFVEDSRLLVNTTSLGMEGMSTLPEAILSSVSEMREQAIVTDIVYVPLETQLLRLAKAAGHKTANGLGMLLYQAVPGFEKWFGRRPGVDDELWQIIISDLGETVA